MSYAGSSSLSRGQPHIIQLPDLATATDDALKRRLEDAPQLLKHAQESLEKETKAVMAEVEMHLASLMLEYERVKKYYTKDLPKAIDDRKESYRQRLSNLSVEIPVIQPSPLVVPEGRCPNLASIALMAANAVKEHPDAHTTLYIEAPNAREHAWHIGTYLQNKNFNAYWSIGASNDLIIIKMVSIADALKLLASKTISVRIDDQNQLQCKIYQYPEDLPVDKREVEQY